MTGEEIFIYDIKNDSRKIIYTAAANEGLLWCEMGCSASGAVIRRNKEGLYLDIDIYDVSKTDFNELYNSRYKKEIKLNI